MTQNDFDANVSAGHKLLPPADPGKGKTNTSIEVETAPEQDTQTRQVDAKTMRAVCISELNYRRLFEAARDGILILDADTGRINDVNPFLVKLLGYSHDEMAGKTVGELSPFKDIESNKVMLERLQKDGYVRYEDLPLESRDGRKIDVEFVCNVYQVGDEKVIQCNVRDITERKAAEKERSRLAAIIEDSEDAIVTTSTNGIVIGWNRGAERLYGYSVEDIIGQSVSLIFPPDHYLEYQRIMTEVRTGNAVPRFDTVRQRKDGALINVSVGITPIEARDGEISGASKISHDITRIKKLEAQVVEAQKMEVIGQLAAGVAHDFNNILMVIMGSSDLAMQNLPPGDPVKNHLKTIKAAVDRAAGLTRQLLIFSNKQIVQLVVLNINDVVNNMDEMLRLLIDDSIEMTILLGQKIGHVKADSGYIGQVLMNLVVNARDAMPNGGRLSITTNNVTLDADYARAHTGVIPGDYAMLAVGDTGTGLTDEVKARLFEAFFTTKSIGKGTGLGLATCQTIVQQSGGHIGVHSTLGQGTTFKIYLPRAKQSLNVAARLVQTGASPRGTETLLVVEDDPSVRSLTCCVLEAQGYEVLSASNGQEGLRVALEHGGAQIRMAVTDVIMPLMGGKVMAEWLTTTYPDLKILFTSGYADDATAQFGALETGVEFLSKPYTLLTLTRKVREMLDAVQKPVSG